MREIVRDAQREIEAARVLREQIAQLAEGDEEFIRDTLEGEVDLDAVVRALLVSDGEDEAMEAGLAGYIDTLKGRKERIAKRREMKRALMASAIEISGRPKIELDIGTVAAARVAPSVITTEEADIPAEFWKAQPPKLDKRKLADALKEGREIPGATLSNGGSAVRITRS